MASHPKALSSPEVTSSYAKMAGENEQEEENDHLATEEEEENEEEENLELGLSLGARMVAKTPKGGGGQWGEFCRILTAKDFPSVGGTRVSPISSSSSVSSSSSMGGRGAAGSKRAADPVTPNQMVGWPPIRASRINSLFNHAKDSSPEDSPDAQRKTPVGEQTVAPKSAHNNARSIKEILNGTQNHEKKPKSFFVKVNMDGMPIGRKVDLNAHRSYESLAFMLEDMFQNNPKPKTNTLQIMRTSKLLDGTSEFALTYEDKDGDWMLVGDVPWGMFLSTVKRLRIMRTTDANGLAPRLRSHRA